MYHGMLSAIQLRPSHHTYAKFFIEFKESTFSEIDLACQNDSVKR